MRRRLNIKFAIILVVVTAVLVGGVHALHGVQVTRNARALLVQADRAEAENNPEKAQDYLRRYLIYQPDDVNVLARYGILLEDQAKTHGNPLAAIQAHERTLLADPGRIDIRQRLVDLGMRVAIENEAYVKLIGLSVRERANYNVYTFANVKPHLEILLSAKPDDAQLLHNLGRCEESTNPKKAVDLYANARAKDPHLISAYVRAANLLRRLGKVNDADQLMDAYQVGDGLIAKNGTSAQAHLARASYRQQIAGRLPQAIAETLRAGADKDVTQALELDPNDAEVQLAAAFLASRQGNLDEAREHLQRGIELAPQNESLYLFLSQLETQAGRPEAALAIIEQGHKAMPNDLGLRIQQAELLIDAGKLDTANQIIEELKPKLVGPAKALFPYLESLSARILMTQGQWREAVDALDKIVSKQVIQSDPGARRLAKKCLMMIGKCHEQLGETQQQYDAYRRAVAIEDPSDPLQLQARLAMASTMMDMASTIEGEENRSKKLADAFEQFRMIMADAPQVGLQIAQMLTAQNLRLPEPQRQWDRVQRFLDESERLKADPAQLALLRAEILLVQNKPEQALRLLTATRDQHRDNVALWLATAALTERLQSPEASLEILKNAERELGDRVGLRLAKASYWIRRGGDETLKALGDLERGLDQFKPTDQDLLRRGLAQAYDRLGSTQNADRLWAEVLQRQPNDLNLRLLQFDRALLSKNQAAAEKTLHEIQRIEGSDDGPLGHFAQAILLTREAGTTQASDRRGQLLAEARKHLERAATLEPKSVRIQAGLADLDLLEGHPDQAVERYRQLVFDLKTDDTSTLVTALRVFNQYGRSDLANQALETRRQRGPIATELQRMAANMAYQSQDYQDALAQAEQTVSDSSTDYREWIWLGQLRWAANQPAEPSFRRAIELAGNKSPDAWPALVTYLAATDPKKAEAAVAEAEAKLSQSKDPQARLALAECYRLIGQSDQGLVVFDTVLKANPDDVNVLKAAALFLLRNNRPNEAETVLRKIRDLKTTPENTDWARRTLAYLTAAKGNTQAVQEALALLSPDEKAGSSGTISTSDLRARAKVLAMRPNRQSRQQAIDTLEAVLKREPATTDDLLLLAQLYEANNNWDKAREQINTLLSRFGKTQNNLAYSARALLRHGLVDEAEADLKELEKLVRSGPGTVEIQARVLAARNRHAEAVDLLRQFAQQDKARLGPVARLLEELARSAGDKKQDYLQAAEQAYRQFAAQVPGDNATLTLAGFLGRQGQTQEALDLCDNLWKTNPDTAANVSIVILYGAKADNAQYQRVDQRLGEAIRANPQKISLLFALANLRGLQERYAEAETILKQIHQQNQTFGSPLNNLAWLVALQGGREDEALALINQAIDLDGETPDLLDTRSVVYLQKQQPSQAIRDLENAIAVSPTADKYFHLARAYFLEGKREQAGEAFTKATKELGLTIDQVHPLERKTFQQLLGELAQH